MRVIRAALIHAWPFLASIALAVVIVASALSVGVIFSQREEYRHQSVVVEGLLEQQEKQTEAFRARLALTLETIDRITTARIEAHEESVTELHQAMLNQIARLLGRPAGIRLDPVAATVARPPAPRAPTTTTTTTTAPKGRRSSK